MATELGLQGGLHWPVSLPQHVVAGTCLQDVLCCPLLQAAGTQGWRGYSLILVTQISSGFNKFLYASVALQHCRKIKVHEHQQGKHSVWLMFSVQVCMMPTTQSTSALLITSNGRGTDLCDTNRETLLLSANHCCLFATQNTRQCGVTAEEMALMCHAALTVFHCCLCLYVLINNHAEEMQSSGATWKTRWTSWDSCP